MKPSILTPTLQLRLLDSCRRVAASSDCKKRRFGALAVHVVDAVEFRGVAEAANQQCAALAHLCAERCIRESIASRTDSMIGACLHAEERVIWEAIRGDSRPSALSIFVAGLDAEGELAEKSVSDFSCIRCATLFYLAGIRDINIWYQGQWWAIPPSEAMQQAVRYALGERAP